MQILYDEINNATIAELRRIFNINNISQVLVGVLFEVWMEEAQKIRARLVEEGLVESVKELDKMIEVQSKFVAKE